MPNYNGGRLAASRYDLQAHIDGTAKQHKADQIVVSPSIIVDGYTFTNVQQAIQTISDFVDLQPDPDATTISKGIIQLAGDISGTNTAVKVEKLYGRNIHVSTLQNNQILTWNYSSNWWEQSLLSSFGVSGDVSGVTSATTVINLNGNPIAGGTPTTNNALTWSGSTWASNYLSIFGDVTGTSNSSVVAKIRGVPVTNPSLSNNYVLAYDISGNWIPKYLPLVGDTSGTSAASIVTKLQNRSVISATINDGYALVWNTSSWTPQYLSVSGDITGTSGTSTVTKLQNITVTNPSLSNNYILVGSTSTWVPKFLSVSGDVTGTSGASTVTKLQNRTISSSAPSNNDVLAYSPSNWLPAAFSSYYQQQAQTFTSNGSWTAPANVYYVVLEGYGGGGQGGGGAAGDTSGGGSVKYSIGGGGGGGSIKITRMVAVTPGSQYTIVIGNGGYAGLGYGEGGATSGAPGDMGRWGDDTIFKLTAAPFTVLATFSGAAGGIGGSLISAPTYYGFAPGGSPTFSLLGFYITGGEYRATSIYCPPCFGRGPGFGGAGIDKRGIAQAGTYSLEGRQGGSGGTKGTDSTLNYFGGGPGGGGAGGRIFDAFSGSGGAGGNGGNGSNSGAGTNGSNGSNAIANSGAGGGGGGGGGQDTSFRSGGAGGNGGSGALRITWWAPV